MSEHSTGREPRMRRARNAIRSRFPRGDTLRRSGFWALLVLVVLVGVATVVVAVYYAANGPPADRIAQVGDAFAAGTFLLAALAAAVALFAYRIASAAPVLVPRIESDDVREHSVHSRDDGIHVALGAPSNGDRQIVREPGFGRRGDTLLLNLKIENTSRWTARNVAVRVDFHRMRRITQPNGWAIAARDHMTEDTTALQWEGGADLAIHGNWPRPLPPLQLNGALIEAPGTDPAVDIEIVADQYRRSFRFPIRWHANLEEVRGGKGAIEGYTGYPSEGVPDLRVWALPVGGKGTSQTTQIAAGPPGKYRWFRIESLEPGAYYIVAYRTGYSIKGAYTMGARDGDPVSPGPDHTLVPVVVKPGVVSTGVRITDWYAPPDALPEEPNT